jgi:hypothetical protein
LGKSRGSRRASVGPRLSGAVADFSDGRFQDDATLIVMAAE